jgi:hypothetical protein
MRRTQGLLVGGLVVAWLVLSGCEDDPEDDDHLQSQPDAAAAGSGAQDAGKDTGTAAGSGGGDDAGGDDAGADDAG